MIRMLDDEYTNPLFKSVLGNRRSSCGTGTKDIEGSSMLKDKLLNISEGGNNDQRLTLPQEDPNQNGRVIDSQ